MRMEDPVLTAMALSITAHQGVVVMRLTLV